jgi:hypothetical protein
MYRRLLVPDADNNIVPLVVPREWYGKEVEIIMFPTMPYTKEKNNIRNADFMKLAGAWESKESAEDMAVNIKASRHFREKEFAL